MNSTDDALAAVAAALFELFPDRCAVAVRSSASIDPGSLLPEIELGATRGAASRLRAEFIAGRTAARAALSELGLSDTIIPIGKRPRSGVAGWYHGQHRSRGRLCDRGSRAKL